VAGLDYVAAAIDEQLSPGDRESGRTQALTGS
jgi:hypothetical protein